MIVMARKTSGDSSRGVPGIILRVIQDSFTTQGLLSKAPRPGFPPRRPRPLARTRSATLPCSSNPALTSLEFGEASLTALRFDDAPK
jgi:hypothetical protein